MTTALLGRRIVVYGVTGSGKTTLATVLAERLGLRRIELDAIRHARGWDSTSFDDMREQLAAAVAEAEAAPGGGWVCEGNYRRVRDVTLPRADTVIWIRLPWHRSFVQLCSRSMKRLVERSPLYGPQGPRESWRGTFFDRKSILWWAIHHHRKTTASIAAALRDAPTDATRIVLRSRDEVNALVDALPRPT